MRRNPLLIDAGIALVLAILVIVISPGLAVVGLLAILVVVISAASFALDRRRRRRRANPVAELRRSRRAETRALRERRPRAGAPGERPATSRRQPRRR